jgi:arsenite-transporting ATPase
MPVSLRTAPHAAAEPTGIPALLEVARSLYGSADPAPRAGAAPEPLLQIRRTAGRGRSLDSEFELVLHLPGVVASTLDLSRIDDDLAVTAGPTRRMVALPSVLRRCTVSGARLSGDDLRVAFTPDPAAWLR